MKKLLLSLLALMAVVSASAKEQSFTIGFNSGSYDGNAVAKTYPERFISEGLDLVKSVDDATNCFYAAADGIRLGTSTKNGNFELTLQNPVKITAIIVSANIWNSDKATLTLTAGTSSPVSVSGLKSNEFTSVTLDNVNPELQEVSKLTLVSVKRIRVNAITVVYDDGTPDVDPDAAPETPVVTVNGQSYGNDAEIEVVKGDMVSVVSANATEMIVNGESVAVSGGTYEFAAETSDIYTFQGKNGEKTSEEVTVMLDVDDLGWQVVVGEVSDALFDMSKPAELIPGVTIPESGAINVGSSIFTKDNVEVAFTTAQGGTATRFWVNGSTIDLRVYSKGTMTVIGEELAGIVIVFSDKDNVGLTASVGTLTYNADNLAYTWTAPEGEAVNKIVFTATKQNRIKTMQVMGVSSETLVKAPEFYVNDVLLDAAGDYMKGIEVEAGAVIKAVGHERTHVHYYVEGEDAAAANVKALMAVNADELPWNVNEGAQKHVFEYTVPAAQSQDITIYAKAAKEGYKSQVTQMVLSADRVATGIEAVESGEGEGAAEYFNLQGQRVMNPANGLFIKKAAGKVTKVVL